MVFAHTVYQTRPIASALGLALTVTVTGALSFLVAFLWRDIIMAIFKHYKLWSCRDGFKTASDLCIAVAIATGATVLAAGCLASAARYAGSPAAVITETPA